MLAFIGLLTLWAVGGVLVGFAAFLISMIGRSHDALLAALMIGAAALIVWSVLFWWVAI